MDDSALTRIYLVHFDDVYRYALAWSADPSIAEEITQETFLRFCQSQKVQKPRAWLIRVARNLAIEYFRHSNTAGGKSFKCVTPSPPVPSVQLGAEEG